MLIWTVTHNLPNSSGLFLFPSARTEPRLQQRKVNSLLFQAVPFLENIIIIFQNPLLEPWQVCLFVCVRGVEGGVEISGWMTRAERKSEGNRKKEEREQKGGGRESQTDLLQREKQEAA